MKLAIRLSCEKDFEELIHFFVYSINTIACLLSKKNDIVLGYESEGISFN